MDINEKMKQKITKSWKPRNLCISLGPKHVKIHRGFSLLLHMKLLEKINGFFSDVVRFSHICISPDFWCLVGCLCIPIQFILIVTIRKSLKNHWFFYRVFGISVNYIVCVFVCHHSPFQLMFMTPNVCFQSISDTSVDTDFWVFGTKSLHSNWTQWTKKCKMRWS